jgi:hypothetical protein
MAGMGVGVGVVVVVVGVVGVVGAGGAGAIWKRSVPPATTWLCSRFTPRACLRWREWERHVTPPSVLYTFSSLLPTASTTSSFAVVVVFFSSIAAAVAS